MERKNVPDARGRILAAAAKVFADKSFEGSRIDEIAREANVPKSLIYYHFKSKDEIFEVLINNFIEEYMGLIQSAVSSNQEEGLLGRVKTTYYEFGMRNADLVRVMFIDSLKKSTIEPTLFKVVEALVDSDPEFSKDKNSMERQEKLVEQFFTKLIPLYAFICFADSWIRYFNVDSGAFGRFFLKHVIEGHEEHL